MKTENFVILTGGPGVGKTTLIEAIAARGYPHAPEVARDIIKEQVASGGDALPWKNQSTFAAEMLRRSIAAYELALKMPPTSKPLFFDRGIPDLLAYVRLTNLPEPAELAPALQRYRYRKTVFHLPIWKEIYVTDQERKQDLAEAIRTDQFMRQAYLDAGYEIVEIPPAPPDARADFLLAHLGLEPSPSTQT